MTENLKPFSYVENGELTGASIEIVREMLKIVGHPDLIQLRPWARAYYQVKNEPDTILFSMARTPDREKFFKWVGPILIDKVYFYQHRDDSIALEALDDAKKLDTILVSRGFPEQAFLESKGFTNLNLTVNPIQNFRMLVNGRGDLAVCGQLALKGVLSESDVEPDLVKKTDQYLFDSELYLAFSDNVSEQEIRVWQEALQSLKTSGRYTEILGKHLIP